MSETPPPAELSEEPEPFRSWLWAHIGRISGVGLFFLASFALVFLAAIGYTPAIGLLIVLIVGVALIALGGRIKNA